MIGRLGVVALLGLMSCQLPAPGEPGRRGRGFRGDPLAGVSVVETVIAPSSGAALQYGGPVNHSLTATEEAVGRALSHLPLQHQPALSKMARELARSAPDRVNVPPGLVDGLMAWAGLVDPPPRLIIVELPRDTSGCYRRPTPQCREAIGSLVQQVESTLPDSDTMTYGVGVVRVRDQVTRMVAAVSDRALIMEPMAAGVGHGRSIEMRGRLIGPRRRPSVEIVDPGGKWRPLKIRAGSDGTFGVTVPCEGTRGAYQVEVLAEGVHGPEVAANFPVYCGGRPPDKMTVYIEKVDPKVSPEQLAFANLKYLNEERKRRGLQELQWDDSAAKIAVAHSHDMQRNGFVGHRSPTTGDASARFARAGLKGAVIRENVARGYGPKGIHDSLMSSPGHRINILAPDVTHVGIGVVVGPAETNVAGAPRPIFATQNFYKKPGAGAPAPKQLVPTMQRRVDTARKNLSLPAVHWDPGLDASADDLARTMAKGRQPRKGFEKRIFALGYEAVESHQVESPDFDALSNIRVWSDPELRHVGVGITRVRDGDGFTFVMVILVAEK